MNGLTPDITAVPVVRPGVLRLTFADGLTGELDVLHRMHGLVFEQAVTSAGFAEVTGKFGAPGTRPQRPSAPAVGYRDGSYRAPSTSCRLPRGCESATRTGVSGFGERI
jgi:hypothetical protein